MLIMGARSGPELTLCAPASRMPSLGGCRTGTHPRGGRPYNGPRHYCASSLYTQGVGLKAIQELLGHSWLSTTTLYVHVHNEHIEQAWNQANQRVTTRLIEDDAMQWNLWMKAAERGIWKSVEMRRLLAEVGAGDQRRQDVDALDNHPDHDQARGPRRDLHRAGVHPSDLLTVDGDAVAARRPEVSRAARRSHRLDRRRRR